MLYKTNTLKDEENQSSSVSIRGAFQILADFMHLQICVVMVLLFITIGMEKMINTTAAQAMASEVHKKKKHRLPKDMQNGQFYFADKVS